MFQRMLKRFKGADPAGGPHADDGNNFVNIDNSGQQVEQQQQQQEVVGGSIAVVPDFVACKTEKNSMRNLLRGRRPSSHKKIEFEEPPEDSKYEDGDGEGSKKTNEATKPFASSSSAEPTEKHESGGAHASIEGNTPIPPAGSSFPDRSLPFESIDAIRSPFESIDAIRSPFKTAMKPMAEPNPTIVLRILPRRSHSSPLTSSSVNTASSADAAAAWAQFIHGKDYQDVPTDSAGPTPIPRSSPAANGTASPQSSPKKTGVPTEVIMDPAGTSLFPPRLPRRTASLNSMVESVHTMATTVHSTLEDPPRETTEQPPLVDDRRGPPRTPMRHPSSKASCSPSLPTPAVKVNLETLARTQFPDFWDATGASLPDGIGCVPDAELTDDSRSHNDGSDSEAPGSAGPAGADRYRTKEDEDVAVFINLMKRMPLSSLLHLLQGHVYSQRSHFSEEYLTQFTAALTQKSSYNVRADQNVYGSNRKLDGTKVRGILKKPNEEGKESSTNSRPTSSQLAFHPKKQFRWAEVTNQHVRTVIKEVESRAELGDVRADIWWTVQEMQSIRSNLLVSVRFFRQHRLGYVQSVEVLCRNSPDPNRKLTGQETAVLESHMKAIMSEEHSFARGLETHICKHLSDHRRATVKAVLEEQNECRTCDDDEETTMICLREQSLAYSAMSGRFAHALARCDHIDALKANLSSWTPNERCNDV